METGNKTGKAIKAILILFHLAMVCLFFIPWLQMEIVPVKGFSMPELAREYYGKNSVMEKVIYILFFIPFSSIFIAWALLFGIKIRLAWILVTNVLVSGVCTALLLNFHFSRQMNILIREGILAIFILSVASFFLYWFWKHKTVTITNEFEA